MNKQIAIALLVAAYAIGLVLHHAPAVGSGQLAAVVVEESAKRTAAEAKIYTSPVLRKTIADRKIAWHLADQDATGPDKAEIQWALDAAQKYQKPVLVTKRGSGTPRAVRLPATAEALAAYLSTH